MKFEISFHTSDTDNKTIKNYDYHPLYDEIKNTFDTFLGSPISTTDEKYEENYIDFDYLANTIPMIKHTLTYSISWNEVSHLNSLIKLLENLDIDCDFKIIDWMNQNKNKKKIRIKNLSFFLFKIKFKKIKNKFNLKIKNFKINY